MKKNDNNREIKKEKKEVFEIVIRGNEIFRINSRTNEVEQVFQCIDQCLRGKNSEDTYIAEFQMLEKIFSITLKECLENQYTVNIFSDEIFTICIEKESRYIAAEYEECINTYIASFNIKRESTELRIWIITN